MKTFVVELPHSEEQCHEALGNMATDVPEFFDQVFWGCKHGIHDGWAIVDARKESDLRRVISPILRDQAKITEVDQFSAEKMKEMHRQAAA